MLRGSTAGLSCHSLSEHAEGQLRAVTNFFNLATNDGYFFERLGSGHAHRFCCGWRWMEKTAPLIFFERKNPSCCAPLNELEIGDPSRCR